MTRVPKMIALKLECLQRLGYDHDSKCELSYDHQGIRNSLNDDSDVVTFVRYAMKLEKDGKRALLSLKLLRQSRPPPPSPKRRQAAFSLHPKVGALH